MCIDAKTVRKFKATIDSNHQGLIPPNLLVHQFTTEAPNKICTSDSAGVLTKRCWQHQV